MGFNDSGPVWWRSMPPVTKNLILINIVIWLVEFCIPSFGRTLINTLGLHYVGGERFNPAQIITYLFIHDQRTPMHVFFNMFSLWMFGRLMEQVWGSRRFFVFYFVCGIGAALVQEGVWALSWRHEYVADIAALNGMTYDSMNSLVTEGIAHGDERLIEAITSFKSQIVTVGASGAVFGLLLGFAFMLPNMPLYLFFIPIPIKAKWMVLGYAVIEFFLGVQGSGTIAHFAHLGGLLFGLILLLYWKKKGTLNGGRYF